MKVGSFVTLFALMSAAQASANTTISCAGPEKENGAWNYRCSDNGGGRSDAICKYTFYVQLEGESVAMASAQKTIYRNAKNVLVWSQSQIAGKHIVNALVASSQCNKK
jgi:hypothetical protein